MDKTITNQFKYDQLHPQQCADVRSHTDNLYRLLGSTAKNMWEIGFALIQVKCSLPHGQFGPWLDHEFGWSSRTAQRFMAVASKFDRDTVSDLALGSTILYELASEKTSDEIRDQLIERAKEGEVITPTTVIKARERDPQATLDVYKESIGKLLDDRIRWLDPDRESIDVADWAEFIDIALEQYKGEEIHIYVEAKLAEFKAMVGYPDAFEAEPDECELKPEPESEIAVSADPVPPPEPELEIIAAAPELVVTTKIGSMAVHHSSESVEHYTPKPFIDLVVDVLGRIDLDPSSNSHTEPNIPAARHYTAVEDGLAQPWHSADHSASKIFLNPPYGRGLLRWVEKLKDEYECGNVAEALALLPGRIDTQWFRTLSDHYCCFLKGRLQFIGNPDPAPFPSIVFYLGQEPVRFFEVFGPQGDIWQRLTLKSKGEKA